MIAENSMCQSLIRRFRTIFALYRARAQSQKFRNAYEDFVTYQSQTGCKGAFILCGYPKSGNTWFRFVYHNLVNTLQNDSDRTLTYSALNEFQANMFFPDPFFEGTFLPPSGVQYGDNPIMFHSHNRWTPLWQAFGPVVFIYRHPLDTMVSMWYATVYFRQDNRGKISLDDFTKSNFPAWIDTFKTNFQGANVAISYEEMRKKPIETFDLCFKNLGIKFTSQALVRAVEVSNFKSIRKMEDTSGEHHGHQRTGAWFNDKGIRFTRSGESGQWVSELQADTVKYCVDLLCSAGVDIDLFDGLHQSD